MTQSVNDRREQFTATGGQTIFPYNFEIFADTDIQVLQHVFTTGITTTLILTTNYTVSGVGDPPGGDVTLVVGAAINDKITVIGDTKIQRSADFNQAGELGFFEAYEIIQEYCKENNKK